MAWSSAGLQADAGCLLGWPETPRPALEEFEFAARHEGEPVVLTRVYLGLTGKLSLDSGQLVPLCEYDDPEVARMLASLVLTGLLSSVIYAPRDRVYDLHKLEAPAPDETLAD